MKRVRHGLLAQNTTWMTLGHGGQAMLRGVYFVLLARALGADGLGTFAGALALIGLLAPFAAWGSGNLLVMQVAGQTKRFSEALGTALVTLGVTAVVLTIAAIGLGAAFLGPRASVELLVILCAADLVGMPLLVLAIQSFQAHEQMRAPAILMTVASTLRLAAVTLFLLTASSSVEDWSYFYLLATLSSGGIGIAWATRTFGNPAFSGWPQPRDLREGFFFSLATASKSIYTDADKVMLLRLSSPETAGAYTAAYRLVAMAFTPIRGLLAAAYARFFRAGAAGVRGSFTFARRLMLPASAYALIVGSALFVAAPLTPIVLGEEYRSSVAVLRWLSALPLIQVVHGLLADALTGAGHQGARSAAQLLVAAVNVALNFALIPIYSWRGAVGATVASEVALAIILLWLLQRRLGRSPRIGAP